MENNFIQIVALASYAVAYAIGLLFKHIIDCVQLYFTNCFTNTVECGFGCVARTEVLLKPNVASSSVFVSKNAFNMTVMASPCSFS